MQRADIELCAQFLSRLDLQSLPGSAPGPRIGSFIALYGLENTRKLIAEALEGRAAFGLKAN
jgi:hypothetical protein